MRKKPARKDTTPKVETEKTPSPARYININEGQEELAPKTKKLWLIVIIFSIFLAIAWLAILKVTVAEETKKINFGQLSREISQTLEKFDTEIKNRSDGVKEVNADDIEQIKNDLEQRLKDNPDSSLWPSHQIDNPKISLSYPDNWQGTENNNIFVLTDQAGTSTDAGYGKISITAYNNKSSYPLADWLSKNKIDLSGYEPLSSVFKFSSSSDLLIFASVEASASDLNRLYYLNSAPTKKVYEIKAEANGDLDYYSPLINEIISTIR